jgi:hypothetical protein
MTTLKSSLIALASLAALAVIGSLLDWRTAVAQNPSQGSAPVHIVAPLPLPVAATQSGAWNVGVAGQPTVLVGNTNTNSVWTRDATETQDVVSANSPPGDIPSGFISHFDSVITVPAGKRLVIEYASASCDSVPTGQAITLTILITTDGRTFSSHKLPTSIPSPGGVEPTLSVGGPVRLYHQGSSNGSVVEAFINRTDSAGVARSCTASISGHMLNVPST